MAGHTFLSDWVSVPTFLPIVPRVERWWKRRGTKNWFWTYFERRPKVVSLSYQLVRSSCAPLRSCKAPRLPWGILRMRSLNHPSTIKKPSTFFGRKSGRCWVEPYVSPFRIITLENIHQSPGCFCFFHFQKGQKWATFSCLHVCQVTAATVFTLSKGLRSAGAKRKRTTSKRSVKNYGFFRCWKKNHWPDIILRLSICRACKGWHGMTWVTHRMLQSNRPVKSLSHH